MLRYATLLFACVPSSISVQQSGAAGSAAGPATPMPRTLAAEAANHELSVVDYKGPYLRYRLRTINEKGDQTREFVETHDGPVARLLLRDGKALTAQQDMDEQARLQSMLDDPDAFRKHTREDGNAKRTATELIRLLPDAMLYSLAPDQPQRSGSSAVEIVLDFKPNPAWAPPTTISQALTGLEGRLWIDTRTHSMAHLEGRIFRSINIGFGVLAHVNPGGTFTVDQAEVVPGRLLVTRFTDDVSLRALVVRSIHQREEASASQFQTVNDMTYTQAIHLLLQTSVPR